MSKTTIVGKRNTVYALIGSIAMPGLGQFYNGEIFKGICFFALFIIVPLSLLLLTISLPDMFLIAGAAVSLLCGIVLYCIPIIDAYRTAASKNDGYILKAFNRWYFYILVWCIGAFWLSSSCARYAQENILMFAHIDTGSMEPAVTNGDYIIFDMTKGSKIKPEKGSIILFRYPDDRSKLFVKRIAGLPGDTVFINDVTMIVPHGHVFVLGDNEKHAIDSRTFGSVPLYDVLGKARQVYFSLGEHGVRWERIGKRL